VHKILSSYDILGGPATFNVLYTTQKYHDENPKTYKALYAALTEASQFIKKNKTKAAETFIRVQKSKLPLEFVKKILDDPENDFTVQPFRTYVYADELNKLGVLKNKAASWRDYFFEEAYAQPGS
jgi:NitT/TauT family transport system substrate-binding protein